MADFSDLREALRSLRDEQVTQRQGVMTDEGPGNAKAYTAILAGRISPEEATQPGKPNGSAFPGIAPDQGQSGTRPVDPVPAMLKSLSDKELRSIINQLHGVKAGRPGSVGSRVKRNELLLQATKALGYQTELPEGQASAAGPFIATPQPGRPGSSSPPSPLPQPPNPSQPSPVTPSSSFLQRRKERSPGFQRILSSPPAPGSNAAIPPVQPITAQLADRKADTLGDAIKRLTDAMYAAGRRQETTVAKEVVNLSTGERMERLKRSGNLLSEGQVKAATLKEKVTQQDVVRESERQEQRKRDQQQEGRKSAVKDAGESLAANLGSSVGRVVSRIAGPRAGEAARRSVQRIAGPAVTQFAGSTIGRMFSGAAGGGGVGGAGAAAAAGGAGGAGAAGGAVGRLSIAGMANPYVALGIAAAAATVAMVKLPDAVDRLGTSLIEGQRHLAMYNAQIAGAILQLDYRKRVTDMRSAQATGGGTSMLADKLGDLREESRWIRDGMTNIITTIAIGAVQLTRFVNGVVKTSGPVLRALYPKLGLLFNTMTAINNWFSSNTGNSGEIIRQMRIMSNYTTPRNRRPGGGGGGSGNGGRGGNP